VAEPNWQDRITVRLAHFLEMSELRKTTVYKLIKTGELRSALIEGRRMIVISSYLDLLGTQPRHDGGSDGGRRMISQRIALEGHNFNTKFYGRSLRHLSI